VLSEIYYDPISIELIESKKISIIEEDNEFLEDYYGMMEDKKIAFLSSWVLRILISKKDL